MRNAAGVQFIGLAGRALARPSRPRISQVGVSSPTPAGVKTLAAKGLRMSHRRSRRIALLVCCLTRSVAIKGVLTLAYDRDGVLTSF